MISIGLDRPSQPRGRLGVAVVLSGEVEERAGLRQAVARLAVVLLQLFAVRADINVDFRVVGEVTVREGPVLALRVVEHLHVRLDTSLIHQPAQHLGRAVAGDGDEARRLDVELLGGAVEHRLGRPNFRLPDPSPLAALPIRKIRTDDSTLYCATKCDPHDDAHDPDRGAFGEQKNAGRRSIPIIGKTLADEIHLSVG